MKAIHKKFEFYEDSDTNCSLPDAKPKAKAMEGGRGIADFYGYPGFISVK